MCCRVSVSPLVTEIAIPILTLGQFHETQSGTRWDRQVPDEGCNVWVQLLTGQGRMEIGLEPSINNWAGHHDKRNAAGIMFEIAARYAEKVGGTVEQTGINVLECKDSPNISKRFLGKYPEGRMEFSRCCPGFQEVFLGTIEQED